MKIIIRYPNRKLYDKDRGGYTTISEIVLLPLGSFQVLEFRTNKDITMDTLLTSLGQNNVANHDKKAVMAYCLTVMN